MKLRIWVLILGLALFAGLGFLKTKTISLQRSGKAPYPSNLNPPGHRMENLAHISRIRPDQGPQVSPADRQKLETLNEILISKNDNDPRLDISFVGLSRGAKELFRTRYQALKPELRNERGTVVYLLGKNLTSPEDIEFLQQVIGEAPCRSLSNCQEISNPPSHEDQHLESVNEVTQAYPQIVALKSLEAYLARTDADPKVAAEAYRNLQVAQDSSIPIVARTARDILSRTKDRG